VAIVDGKVAKENGVIENYLGPIQRYQGHVKWGVVPADGHFASTSWKVLKRFATATLLHLMPKTGKTHQLRVHTSGMGHPILGDFTYGKTFRCPYKAPRTLLHAKAIAFQHPVTGEKLELSCPLPADFEACLAELA
jgi:23S rRNA-/tRNA-specific pseudouridylate synthase